MSIEEIFIWQYFPTNLNRLHLSNNDMETFPPNFFASKRLETLVELVITSNPLTKLQARDLIALRNLELLELTFCFMNELAEDLLFHLKSLKYLILVHNSNLIRLPDSLLYGMDNLIEVRIELNALIQEIPMRFFLGASQLDLVRLSYMTGLTSDGIPYDVFHSSNTTRSIRIWNNPNVTILKNTWLKNLNYPGRVWLYFFYNGIQSIERGAFDGVPNADLIQLNNNDLSPEGIPNDLFVKFEGSSPPLRVYLYDNPRLPEAPPACNVTGVSCRMEW